MHYNNKIAQTFSKGAQTYDEKGILQSRVSEQLIQYIMKHEQNLANSNVLDIGCGTGRRAAELAPQCKSYTQADISETMVHQAMSKCPHGLPVVVDAQSPCFTASFDIIISSLTLHWLQDPKQGLQQLIGCLKPGGRLYLTTMGANSFYEWRTAHSVLDEPCGTPDFIPMGALKSWLPTQGEREVFEQWIVQEIDNPLEYFQNLKRMGAGHAHPSHKPLPASVMRRVLRHFSQQKRMSYQVLFASYTKPLEHLDE
jgi:malonyl-CoA O-methyltransferase